MDKVSYLTPNIGRPESMDEDTLYSRLLRSIYDIKQERAGAAQWIGIINGLTQKGVKLAEIEDSSAIDFLKTFSPSERIEKSALLNHIIGRLPRIKCVDLGQPAYAGWKNISDSDYGERFYILSSEGMVADDRLEDLLFRIEDLGFNPGPLLSDPDIVDRLEGEMALIKKTRPQMYDFTAHHYSEQVKNHGKNLMAHARTSIRDDLFFVEEIQSDWAQRGRSSNWASNYPKAPFVTNTEQWSGVVLRDLMHQAASNPQCKRFAWINSNMRNGWDAGPNAEHDDLSTFYATIVKKLATKTIEKADGKVAPMDVATKNGVKTVLGFEMTDKVRAALVKALPMYSREALLPRGTYLADPERWDERTRVVQSCAPMLGSAHTIRFVAKVYDLSQGMEIAGKYLNRGIELSLRAKDLTRVARHEAWHFADENFLLPHEKREMRLVFSSGSELNQRTQAVLRSMGEEDAAAQCIDDKECAAHAFSLWCDGALTLDEKPKSIFESVLKSLNAMADWLEEKVFGVKVQKPEDLFTAMRDGVLAMRQDEMHDMEPSPH